MEESAVYLRAQGIGDDNDVGVGRGRQARGLSGDDEGGVVRGRGIDDASEGLETTTEASGAL